MKTRLGETWKSDIMAAKGDGGKEGEQEGGGGRWWSGHGVGGWSVPMPLTHAPSHYHMNGKGRDTSSTQTTEISSKYLVQQTRHHTHSRADTGGQKEGLNRLP